MYNSQKVKFLVYYFLLYEHRRSVNVMGNFMMLHVMPLLYTTFHDEPTLKWIFLILFMTFKIYYKMNYKGRSWKK